MENGKFNDCFGYKLKESDDIIISIDDILYDGFISKIYDNIIEIIYHYWKNDKEIEKSIKYYDFDMHDNKLQNIYKIR